MRKILILAACLFLSLSASAASQDEIIKTILSLCNQNKEWSSAFEEDRFSPRKEKVSLKGNLTYRCDDYLSMEYTVASEKFLIDGNKMINRREGKEMVYDLTKNLAMRNLSSTLLYAFSGQLVALSKEQTTSLKASESGDCYLVVLEALKKQARGYSRIEISYRKKDGRILQMKMDEFIGLSTVYRLAK